MRKKSGDKIREKSGGPKIKIREKSDLPKTDPDILWQTVDLNALLLAYLGHRGGTRVAAGTVVLQNPKGTSRRLLGWYFQKIAFNYSLGK